MRKILWTKFSITLFLFLGVIYWRLSVPNKIAQRFFPLQDQVTVGQAALMHHDLSEVEQIRNRQLARQSEWFDYAKGFFDKIERPESFEQYLTIYHQRQINKEKALKKVFGRFQYDQLLINELPPLNHFEQAQAVRLQQEEKYHLELKSLLLNHYDAFLKLHELVQDEIKDSGIQI